MPRRARFAFTRFTIRVHSLTRLSRSRLGRRASSSSIAGDRSHAAVLRLTAQPAEEGTLEQLGIEAIRLGPPMLTRDRDARWVDHVGFDLMCAQPARQPEAIATGLIGDGDPLDRAPSLGCFLAPAMQKLQQSVLVGRELLQRLAFEFPARYRRPASSPGPSRSPRSVLHLVRERRGICSSRLSCGMGRSIGWLQRRWCHCLAAHPIASKSLRDSLRRRAAYLNAS